MERAANSYARESILRHVPGTIFAHVCGGETAADVQEAARSLLVLVDHDLHRRQLFHALRITSRTQRYVRLTLRLLRV